MGQRVELATTAGSLEVTDGTHTVTGVTELNITSGGTVSSGGTGVADLAISGGTGGALTPTATKSSGTYTASAGDLVIVDLSTASVTIDLPDTGDKVQVGYKIINYASPNTLTIQLQGSDVFDKTGGATSATPAIVLDEAKIFQRENTGAIWFAISGDLPLSQLDARYELPGASGPGQLPSSVVTGSSSGGIPAWAASTAYAVNTLVTNGGNTYICTTAHTSGSTFSGESGDWQQVGSSSGLAPTAVKTANYNASASDFVPCDISGGSFTVTLPTAPADKTQVGVKVVKTPSSGTYTELTITCGGSDVLDIASGNTTFVAATLNQTITLQYKASSAIWYVLTDDRPLNPNLGAVSLRRPFGWLENVPLWEFGHSYVSGSGAGALFGRLPGRQNMGTASNRGSAGTNAGQMAQQILTACAAATTYPSGSLSGLNCLCSLINDVNGSFTSATVVEEYRSCFAQLWGNGQIVAITAGNRFAFGSGWTAGVTSTGGSYFDYSWYGNTGYILCTFITGTSPSITVSGSGTGGATYSTPTIGGYSNSFPGVIKLTGFGAGNHTVRVTFVSGSGMTVLGGIWQNMYPPSVLWAQEGAISSYSGAQNTTLTSTYPTAVAAILGDFPSVTVVAVDSNWNNGTMQYSDGVHLNARGNAYWTDLLEMAAYNLGYQTGMDTMIAYPSGNYGTSSSSNGASFPAPNYNSGTINTSTTYANLKTWTSDASYIYALDSGNDFGSTNYVGANIVITGGTGWTPGTYTVISQQTNYSTPDGTHTMLRVVQYSATTNQTLGYGSAFAAAANTAGGAGYLSP